jgi:hypothetical protein
MQPSCSLPDNYWYSCSRAAKARSSTGSVQKQDGPQDGRATVGNLERRGCPTLDWDSPKAHIKIRQSQRNDENWMRITNFFPDVAIESCANYYGVVRSHVKIPAGRLRVVQRLFTGTHRIGRECATATLAALYRKRLVRQVRWRCAILARSTHPVFVRQSFRPSRRSWH